MGRGSGQPTSSASAILYGQRHHRKLGSFDVQSWARRHSAEYAEHLARLDTSTRLGALLEEKAALEHEEVLDGNAEIIPVSLKAIDAELYFEYELSPLESQELEDAEPGDTGQEGIMLRPEELIEPEIVDAVAPALMMAHRKGLINLRG